MYIPGGVHRVYIPGGVPRVYIPQGGVYRAIYLRVVYTGLYLRVYLSPTRAIPQGVPLSYPGIPWWVYTSLLPGYSMVGIYHPVHIAQYTLLDTPVLYPVPHQRVYPS